MIAMTHKYSYGVSVSQKGDADRVDYLDLNKVGRLDSHFFSGVQDA